METRTGFYKPRHTVWKDAIYRGREEESQEQGVARRVKKKKKEAFEVCFPVKVAKDMWKPASV